MYHTTHQAIHNGILSKRYFSRVDELQVDYALHFRI